MPTIARFAFGNFITLFSIFAFQRFSFSSNPLQKRRQFRIRFPPVKDLPCDLLRVSPLTCRQFPLLTVSQHYPRRISVGLRTVGRGNGQETFPQVEPFARKFATPFPAGRL